MNLKNILWNLIGLGFPLLVAALTVPKIIGLIGLEKFGFLTLAWGLIGYSGVLDLGIGRAVTQRVSTMRGTEKEKSIPALIKTAVSITTIVGFLGFLLLLLVTVFEIDEFFKREKTTVMEIKLSLFFLSVALPLQAISSTYKGINEAYLNFKGISIVRVFLGVTNFLGPFLIASFLSFDLHWLVFSLLISRIIALYFYRRLGYKCIPEYLKLNSQKFNLKQAKDLIKFGGWVTISSIVSPFLVQADRFFIGVLISAAAVAIYVVPYEVTVQSLILVSAITSIAFPAISNSLVKNKTAARKTFNKWLVRIVFIMLLSMAFLSLIMPYILDFWVGDYIGKDAVIIGRILCIGVFFNSIGSMFYSFLQASNRPKVTAIIHLIELPIFLLLLYFLIVKYGVFGAAIAWSFRTFVDMSVLGFFSYERKVKQ